MASVFAKFVGTPQTRLDAVETVGDIRSAMNAGKDVSISLMAGDGKQLSDDTLVEANEIYLIATKTEGSKGERVLVASVAKNKVILTKKGAKYALNGEELTKAQVLKLVNGFINELGYANIEFK